MVNEFVITKNDLSMSIILLDSDEGPKGELRNYLLDRIRWRVRSEPRDPSVVRSVEYDAVSPKVWAGVEYLTWLADAAPQAFAFGSLFESFRDDSEPGKPAAAIAAVEPNTPRRRQIMAD